MLSIKINVVIALSVLNCNRVSENLLKQLKKNCNTTISKNTLNAKIFITLNYIAVLIAVNKKVNNKVFHFIDR